MAGRKLPSRWTLLLLRFYRLSLVLLIVVLIRQHFEQLRIQGAAPIEVEELKSLLPNVARLSVDSGPRAGLFLWDETGADVGYAVRTSPAAAEIIGYAGPTDVLLVFGTPNQEPNPVTLADPSAEPIPTEEPTRKLLGIQVRHSWDTTRHIKWVVEDAYYMQFWQGRDWDNLASLNFYDEYFDGVSGATLSSMGMARSIQHRIRVAEEAATALPAVHFSSTDYGLLIALAVGILVTFRSGWKGRRNLWLGLKLAAIVYVGFLNGSLIALSVLAGYVSHGLAWRIAPGLVALVVLCFLIPWTTRRQVYCQQICPHGAAQQLLSRYSPWKFSLPTSLGNGLRWLPWCLLVVLLIFMILPLPLEFSHLEPFDAYLFRQSDWIPIVIAVGSLVISAFVPMAYCKYGCPTGALLEFARGHGRTDHFSRKDLAAAALLVLTFVLIQQRPAVEAWLEAPVWQMPTEET